MILCDIVHAFLVQSQKFNTARRAMLGDTVIFCKASKSRLPAFLLSTLYPDIEFIHIFCFS